MKILYVEDELSKNIPKIKRIFEKYLGKDIIKQLSEFEKDDFGASPEEIKQCVNGSGIVNVEYNFVKALELITNHIDDYSLLVVDRNLSQSEYDFAEIRKIIPQYSEKLYDMYFEREGDYILTKVAFTDYDVLNKFYFVTANSSSELKNKEDIERVIDYGEFTAENIIDKSDSKALEKLRTRINQNVKLNIKLDNISYLTFLEKNIGINAANKFFELLENKGNSIGNKLTSCRILLENLLTELAKKMEKNNSECWRYSKGDKKELNLSGYIREIINNEYKKYKSNEIIRNAFYSIKSISNEFGAHEDLTSVNGEATEDTVQTLIFGLKDIITWLEREHY